MRVRPFFDDATHTFTYLLDDREGCCAVIDAVLGLDVSAGRVDEAPARAVADAVEQEGMRLEWILETHVHADHLSGAHWLRDRLGGRIATGAGVVQVQRFLAAFYNLVELRWGVEDFDRLLLDGDCLAVGGVQVEALHVPGHTPADMAYRVKGRASEPDAVFVGDTLFMPDAGTARCDFPGGDAAQLYRSVRRLLSMEPRTQLHVCHDYPARGDMPRHCATVAEHRASNVHVGEAVDEAGFVQQRQARDAQLQPPASMLFALQVNARAGRLPAAEDNGTSYLKIPLNALGR